MTPAPHVKAVRLAPALRVVGLVVGAAGLTIALPLVYALAIGESARPYALTLLVARVLRPEDYGIVALSETLTPFIATLSGFGLSTWMVRESKLTAESEGAMFSLAMVFAGIATLAVVLAAPWVARFYAAPQAAAPICLVGLILLLQGLAVTPAARLQRDLNFKPIGLMNLFISL